MGIADAITALGPVLYWPMDTGSSSGLGDYSGHSRPGTPSGSVDFTMVGPETGTKATRLFGTAQVVGTPFGFTGAGDYSLMIWASVKDVANSTFYDIWRVGNLANAALRGMRLFVRSPAVAQITGHATTAGSALTVAAGYPASFWHVITGTWKNDTKALTTWVDLVQSSQVQATGMNGLIASDQAVLVSPTPMVVAHAAVFDKVLTSTQISTVVEEIAPWPYELPINKPLSMPTDTATSSDIDDVQAQLVLLQASQVTQSSTIEATNDLVEDIKGYWNGYTSTTLPSLGALLDGIKLDLQTTVEGAAGALAQSVGDLLSSRPPDPFAEIDISGGISCEQIVVAQSLRWVYGYTLELTSWPEDWKFRTPDHAWGLKDLATIRFFRGGQLVGRFGVHTTSFNVDTPPGTWPAPSVAGGGWYTPPDYTVIVDFHEGVCGILKATIWP